MKIAKQNKNLLEQTVIQKKIIEELNYRILLLEEEIKLLKENNEKTSVKSDKKCVEICDTCGKLFLFTSSDDCCK